MIVRAYGEMVDLLWSEDKSEAAIALETLWNSLAAKYSFSLLCAYSKHSLARDGGHGIDAICGQHMHVLPSEFDVRAFQSPGAYRSIARRQLDAGAVRVLR